MFLILIKLKPCHHEQIQAGLPYENEPVWNKNKHIFYSKPMFQILFNYLII